MLSFERAQHGRNEIENAIADLLNQHPDGLRNIDIAEKLGLRSSPTDEHKNFLTWAILGGMVATRRLEKTKSRPPLYHFVGRGS